MIFHRLRAGIICLAFFVPMILIGFLKLPFHYICFRLFNIHASGKFIYRFMKAIDCAACAACFDGKSDETISNRAGQIWMKEEWHSPVWVIFVKKITDRFEPDHLEKSIESTREETL